MSRTKRYIPHYARYPQPFELAWRGLGDWSTPLTGEDPRNRWDRGYDKHHSSSYIYFNYRGHSGYRESVNGKSRHFFKRYYHKVRRMIDKDNIKHWIMEMDHD